MKQYLNETIFKNFCSTKYQGSFKSIQFIVNTNQCFRLSSQKELINSVHIVKMPQKVPNNHCYSHYSGN